MEIRRLGALGAAAVLGALILVAWGPAAAGPTVVVKVAPPQPHTEVLGPSPGPGHLWVAGHWVWDGSRHVWVGGRWMPERPGFAWAPGHWRRVPGGWQWVEGHWRRP